MFGTAGEHRCASAAAARRRLQRVARVQVTIYRLVGHGGCRFVQRGGGLSAPRWCRHPIEFRARGRSRWSLRLSLALPAGRYLIRSDAVDRLRHHQPRAAASTARITVRS